MISCESKQKAEKIARKLNRKAGKKIYAVLEENGEWIVISVNELVRNEIGK